MSITVRNAIETDGNIMRYLASNCGVLDIHTPYTYWVLANYANDSCFILQNEAIPIGFITALSNGNKGFIWQIGILSEYRQHGYSDMLIDAVIGHFKTNHIITVETTIASDNTTSYRAFHRYCQKRNIPIEENGRAIIPHGDILFIERKYVLYLS